MKICRQAVLLLFLIFGEQAVAGSARKNPIEIMKEMKKKGQTGVAHKTKIVDVRPAKIGEIITTIVGGKVETTNTAQPGDFVVRNRCPATGNEEIIVRKAVFHERYSGPLKEPSLPGMQAYKPIGNPMNYFVVPPAIGNFEFTAPWGSPMTAEVGDMIVQAQGKEGDTYRIAKKSFECTYNIVSPVRAA